MKKTIIASLILMFSLSGSTQTLVEVWRTGPVLKTPESVLYYPELGVIFVANIDGDPVAKDGKGSIAQVTPDGQVKSLEWVKGLNAPKGMAVFDGRLYVSDIDELVEIDIAKAEISNHYPAPEAIFLNDVAASDDGKIFVSDSRTNKIHVLENGNLSDWTPDLEAQGINGLFAEGDYLYVGSDKIQRIDMRTKETETIQEGCGGIDGLCKDNDNQFIFSNWAGRVFYLENGKMKKMIDTSAEKVNTADLSFANALNLLLVPTFFDNQIIAYQVGK